MCAKGLGRSKNRSLGSPSIHIHRTALVAVRSAREAGSSVVVPLHPHALLTTPFQGSVSFHTASILPPGSQACISLVHPSLQVLSDELTPDDCSTCPCLTRPSVNTDWRYTRLLIRMRTLTGPVGCGPSVRATHPSLLMPGMSLLPRICGWAYRCLHPRLPPPFQPRPGLLPSLCGLRIKLVEPELLHRGEIALPL